MTTHYRVSRPVTPADLDARPGIAGVLKMIPPRGYVTFEQFKHVGKDRAGRGVAHARAIGVLERVPPHERILNLDSVKFWCTQLNEPGHKNTSPDHSTRQLYLGGLSKLNDWLPGRLFPSYKTVVSGGQVERQAIKKSFANVEELMEYCITSDHGTKTAQRVVREFLASPHVSKTTAGVRVTMRSSIKSYFDAHDIVIVLPKQKEKRADPACEDDSMSLEDFYRMVQNGNPGVKHACPKRRILMRTIMLIKLQSGMDSSTLADRFNYEGYSQIARHFKTEDHSLWSPDMCPVPIKVIRVKTTVQHTTFLDCDAIAQLQEYLAWKEAKCGRHDGTKPLFLTKQNTPIRSKWVSLNFSKIAARAGVQKKVSHRVFKMRAHDVRDLLKSTLLASGCKQYAAEHIIGHAPRDSYEKQATLYPEDLRAEYAKASSRLNIFSKVESTLGSPKDPESQEARIRELEAEVAALKQSKATNGMAENHYEATIAGMGKEIKQLAKILDSLPDDVKARMAGDLERK